MSQKTILIIEDSTDLADSLEDMLIIKGYKALVAKDGRNGLGMAIMEKPDLILLDLRLPDINGIEVMNELRQDSWGKQARVLILTASDVTEKTISDLKVKSEDIIHKSHSGINDLILRIEKELA
jgi:DNA-binding response OmpR family regulator